MRRRDEKKKKKKQKKRKHEADKLRSSKRRSSESSSETEGSRFTGRGGLEPGLDPRGGGQSAELTRFAGRGGLEPGLDPRGGGQSSREGPLREESPRRQRSWRRRRGGRATENWKAGSEFQEARQPRPRHVTFLPGAKVREFRPGSPVRPPWWRRTSVGHPAKERGRQSKGRGKGHHKGQGRPGK